MRYIKSVVSVVSITLFFQQKSPTNLTEGTKEKTATTDGHNYNKYDRRCEVMGSFF